MSTLYELTADFQNLLMLAEDPDTDPQAFADTLEGIEGELEDKADNYARVIRNLEADASLRVMRNPSACGTKSRPLKTTSRE